MNQTLWISISLVLIMEGLGPMLFPNTWRNIIRNISRFPNNLLRRYGGSLVVSGLVIYFILSNKYILN